MTDPSTSGNRWEPTADPAPAPQAPDTTPAATAPAATTAVQDPPPPPPADAWAPPPVPERRGLKDRWQHAPRGARLGAGGVVTFLLLLGIGLGAFALGRGTAPDGDGQPGGVRDGHPGGRDHDGDGDGDLGGPRGLPGQGTTSSWYVVPSPLAGTGTSAA